ncbi:FKBP-type peptidyl-prolyl cis-trans isomerase [Thermophagus xiamenensis]|uniref:Peptidyl-prolyl cis-trans isomerase n=2 Tax=Thermophagus xiamenensis TaxID=385682 RepID=A0A1I2EFK3_9BACT|nr:FKBP-type peptidyl-prolyl cis-trans isomerase [Thermophagus xiamenensis]SFE91040.1 FKBP-type peptidyl-prolyl cis-trans isomerase [Thermophagus xiamenensis]
MRAVPALSKVILSFFLVSFCSCSGSQNRDERGNSVNIPLETYIKVNRKLVEKEQEKIKQYVEDNQLDMHATGTGLWYRIDEPGTGDFIQKGQIVTLDYKIKLLDGTLCYDSEELGPKEFLVGRGGVESGLEEGILMLKNGGRALFIMPPHLAHGLIGDDEKIPSRAIIIYEVEVVDVKFH